jgi:teichuronic acid biosynthesis glycosyltransferase TuaH
MTPDFVFFTLFRTDHPYSSISLSMARELARTHRVWYVQAPYTWWEVFKGVFKRDPGLQRRWPGLWRGRIQYEKYAPIPDRFIAVVPPAVWPVNWLPEGRVYRFFRGLNERRILRAIHKTLRDHQVQDFWYINCYHPFYAGVLPATMGARGSIYHCIDDISQDPYTRKHGIALENDSIRRADITLVTSTRLFELKKHLSPGVKTFFNAADTALFETAATQPMPRPDALENHFGRVIGFLGNLDALRIDYGLLKKIALHFREDTLLLVGPVNSQEPAQIGLSDLPNVAFAGSQPLERLPAFLQHMNVVLIPFLHNTLTESIYPLKINEYLAAGKPVVSTEFSADIRQFAPLIYLADRHETFIRQLEQALQENAPERQLARREVARQNSWQQRIGQLLNMINEHRYDLPK